MTILAKIIDKIQRGIELDDQEFMLANTTLEVIFHLQDYPWKKE